MSIKGTRKMSLRTFTCHILQVPVDDLLSSTVKYCLLEKKESCVLVFRNRLVKKSMCTTNTTNKTLV